MPVDTEELISRLRSSKSTVVLTGAGVSAASGIPTFRGEDGLWRQFRAEDLATPEAFAMNPQLVWEWYDWRRTAIAAARPNAAHEVLARWSERPGFALITQNVDGLHERAGTRNLIRFHGSIWELRCAAGCGAAPWESYEAPIGSLPPTCPACAGIARPGVVWFGENIDPDVLERSSAVAARRRCLPVHRHVVSRLPRGRPAPPRQAQRRVHRGNQSRRHGHLTHGRSADRRACGRRALDARRSHQDGLMSAGPLSAGPLVRRRYGFEFDRSSGLTDRGLAPAVRSAAA